MALLEVVAEKVNRPFRSFYMLLENELFPEKHT